VLHFYPYFCYVSILLKTPDITADDLTAHISKAKPGWEIDSIEIFRSLDDFNIDESQQQEMGDGGQDFAGDPGAEPGGMTMKM